MGAFLPHRRRGQLHSGKGGPKVEDPYVGCEPSKKDSRFLPEAWTRVGETHFDNSELELAMAAVNMHRVGGSGFTAIGKAVGGARSITLNWSSTDEMFDALAVARQLIDVL